jgi:hypothetical protein
LGNDNGKRGDYGGDEEPTPAEPSSSVRISAEARLIVNLGLEHSHASECYWRLSRIYDTTAGDDRDVLLATLISELSAIIDANIKARAALVKRRGELKK